MLHQTDWAFFFDNAERLSFNDAFRLYYRALCFFAAKIINEKTGAEDIVVDVFIRVSKRTHPFKNHDELRSFLFASTKNACIDHLRKSRMVRGADGVIEAVPADVESAAEREMIFAQVLQAIYAEMENLPSQCQKIFKDIFLEGKDVSTIATEMNLSRQTVLNHKSRAIKLLRIAFMKEGPLTFSLFALWLVYTPSSPPPQL